MFFFFHLESTLKMAFVSELIIPSKFYSSFDVFDFDFLFVVEIFRI